MVGSNVNISQEHATKAVNLLSQLANQSHAFCSCIEIEQNSSLYGDRWMMEVKDLINRINRDVLLSKPMGSLTQWISYRSLVFTTTHTQ
jgi:hypothetical protein